ncbi:egg-laying defective protein 27-like [Dermacentor silvarum]|uniref:egg-laying defective protein 27-like n=1 Tax=Dermacentor silvarum TaxID=543639 RepID=UPI002100932C|nr:egg-laying defective protein 27-like [Dermacentor silvarum]
MEARPSTSTSTQSNISAEAPVQDIVPSSSSTAAEDKAARRRAADAERKRRKRAADAELRERETAARRQRRQADPEQRAREAAGRRQRRAADPSSRERHAAATRQRRAADPGVREREAAARKRRRLEAAAAEAVGQRQRDFRVGEAPAAADGVKAQTVRVHRTERRWPLVTCRHHSTSAAETLGVATADFSAVFPAIDFTQAVEAGCDKPPFIEASLVSTTCQVEPWRGLQDKCVGEYEAVLQHAEQSCQTEHHITLVQCAKPQVSSCSVEVQADDLWWQRHCGTGPIGVDLCEPEVYKFKH